MTLFRSSAFAEPPADVEFYSERPPIESVRASPSRALPDLWKELRDAQIDFAAQILGLYEDHEIYFLARDAEYVYDTAKIFATEMKNFHLLNISRGNMSDPLLFDFLTQEKVTETVQGGKPIVFVDTGFAGTIPAKILSHFPESSQDLMKTHLIVSDNPEHPSSRSFLIHLDAALALNSPQNLHSSIVNYEHLAHFTYRADTFRRKEGRLIPASEEFDEDGKRSHSEALLLMSDLKAYLETPQAKERFNLRLAMWRALRASNGDEVQLKLVISQFGSKLDGPEEVEAVLRDYFQAARRNSLATSVPELMQFGLAEVVESIKHKSSKQELKAAYPHLAAVFDNPATKIPKLVVSKNWADIGTLMDLPLDVEMKGIIIQNLFRSGDVFRAKELLKAISNNSEWKELVLENIPDKIDLAPFEDIILRFLDLKGPIIDFVEKHTYKLSEAGERLWVILQKNRNLHSLVDSILGKLEGVEHIFHTGEEDAGSAHAFSRFVLERKSQFSKAIKMAMAVKINAWKPKNLNGLYGGLEQQVLAFDPEVLTCVRPENRKFLTTDLMGNQRELAECVEDFFSLQNDDFPLKRLYYLVVLLDYLETSSLQLEYLLSFKAQLGPEIWHSINEVANKKEDVSNRKLSTLKKQVEAMIEDEKPKAEAWLLSIPYIPLESDPSLDKGQSHKAAENFKVIEHLGKASTLIEKNSQKWVQKPAENLEDLDERKREMERLKVAKELGFTRAVSEWAADGKSLLRTYIEGKSAGEIIESDPGFLKDAKHPAREALHRFILRAAKEKIYFGNLSPNNLIYDGKDWQIIKVGSIRERPSMGYVMTEYGEKLFAIFSKSFPNKTAELKEMFEKITCIEILGEIPALPTDFRSPKLGP